jgi:hypothetical protein
MTMKSTRTRGHLAAALVGALTVAATIARAGEIGHYAPGVPNIRDFAVPDPGFCGAVYNYWYSTDRLNDRNGNKVSSVTVGPAAGVTLGVDVNVDVYASLAHVLTGKNIPDTVKAKARDRQHRLPAATPAHLC